MDELNSLLQDELARLDRILSITKSRLSQAPEGTMRLSKTKNYLQYYHCTKDNKLGKYIPKGNAVLVQMLAQKAYDEKVLAIAERNKKIVSKFSKQYKKDEIEQVFRKEHPERQKFIQPVEKPWEEMLDEWKNIPYQSKGFDDNMSVILTNRGERVRSKTEKIMADHFLHRGLEYKYECPLYISGYGYLYPDFTFLSAKTGKEMYWEHFGLVEDPTYARAMVKKINTYQDHGIFLGERLIVSFETEQVSLNSKRLDQLIQKYLRV